VGRAEVGFESGIVATRPRSYCAWPIKLFEESATTANKIRVGVVPGKGNKIDFRIIFGEDHLGFLDELAGLSRYCDLWGLVICDYLGTGRLVCTDTGIDTYVVLQVLHIDLR
jgi:hypothetical protein